MITLNSLSDAGQRHRQASRQALARRSFTLVELLMVLVILAFLFGAVSTLLGPRTIHGPQVKAAADQLASVLRKARQMAMDHRSMYGVSFNIANAPGSSGSVLNNRAGGHWYRIIGPHDPGSGSWSGAGSYNLPAFFGRNSQGSNIPNGDTELGGWLNAIKADFVGEKYVLPKGQARFVALTDEDNGNYWVPQSCFGPTYPRPWFGDFVTGPGDSQPRLYCWGGYEAKATNLFTDFGKNAWWGTPVRAATTNYTGFYYQGDDPAPLVGCMNTCDRYIIDDPAGTSSADKPGMPQSSPPSADLPGQGMNYRLFTKGEVRPLVNGDWLDCVILFNPDGTASMADWMAMRHQYGQTYNDNGTNGYCYWNENDHKNLTWLGPGDMCNTTFPWAMGQGPIPYNTRFEASNYVDVTGMYYITIGSDMPDDTVAYPTAQAALSAMLPLYRVAVSRLGEVKVVKVRTSLPSGKTLNSRWQGAMWSNNSQGFIGYWNNHALSATGDLLMPSEDAVTPAMMTNQQWWFDP